MSIAALESSAGPQFGTSIETGLPPVTTEASRAFDKIKQDLHLHLVHKLDFDALNRIPADKRRQELKLLLEGMLESSPPLTVSERDRMVLEIVDETLGLGPLEALLRDTSINDILINGPSQVYIERDGRLQESSIRFQDSKHLLQILDRIVARVGRRIDETSPMVDARLQDGSRVNAIISPLSLRGPVISIRRFGAKPLGLLDLLAYKSLTPEIAFLIEAAVQARLNIVVSGGTGSGKTTLLNTMSGFISPDERVITIEDAAELQLQQKHVVQLESRPPNIEGKGQVAIRDLMRNALRMRPDRIIIGECRGAEALDMLQAMNTGHDGSLTTLHANTPRDALARLETMILMAGLELPIRAMRQQTSSAIQLIVQTSRLQGGDRKITHVTEVDGMEGDTIIMQDIFQFRQVGLSESGKAIGRFEATGVRPHFASRLVAAGIKIPPRLFEQRALSD